MESRLIMVTHVSNTHPKIQVNKLDHKSRIIIIAFKTTVRS